MRILGFLVFFAIIFSELPSSAQTQSTFSHGFSTFGELKYPSTFSHFDYVNPNAPKGGEIKIAGLGTFDTLNPFIIKGSPAQGIMQCNATLLESSFDEPATHYGYVAESISVAPDLSWVIFKLNPKACFNNGKPITADDIIFSFNILREKGQPLFRTYYKAITKVEKLSDFEVKFHCPGNKSREIPAILGQLPALSKAYYETHPFEETTLTPPPSSGSYEVMTLDAGRSITYKRVKNWWGENIPSQKGRHNFDIIKIDYYRDANAMFEAFKNGQVDIRYEGSSKLWSTAYTFPAVEQGFVKKERIKHSLCIPGSYGLFFNTRREIFSDRKVRQALTEMFDFNWANKNLFYNTYQRIKSYFPNTPFAATGVPESEEKALLEPYKGQIPAEVFESPFTLPEHNNEQDIRKSSDKALKLLKEAGWEIKNQKLVNVKTGKPFTFETLIYDQSLEKIFLHFQGYLKLIGIEMKVRLVDVSTYQERIDQYDYDMILSSIPQSPTPGNEQRDMWGSAASNMKGSANKAGIHEKTIDEIIEKLIDSKDYKTLLTTTKALDRLLLWGYYMIPAWTTDSIPVAFWNRFSRSDISPPYNPFTFDAWWIDTEKEKKLPSHLQRYKGEEKSPAVQPAETKPACGGIFCKVWSWIKGLFGSK
ncbi:MAG: extracellular solute-binding protein [Alphaproteobacteria bacterium]|nr:extracellular solute-binding protein [Alphaproteobacteria bacterium]